MAIATSVKLLLTSEVRLIDLVHVASEKMAETVGLDADEALNVGLALREAVINAIIHGNRRDPSLPVEVTLTANGGKLVATVQDHGGGFDPDAMPDPTSESNVLQTSGRGLLLMRAFVDEIEFRRVNGGMQVTLTKNLPGNGSP
jgi:serine/threonine-protein kinase RsbW